MIGFGVADAVGSFIVGHIAKSSGRPLIFFCASLINVTLLLLMLLWQPSHGPLWLLYVIPVFWGVGDAIWQTITAGKFIYIEQYMHTKCLVLW